MNVKAGTQILIQELTVVVVRWAVHYWDDADAPCVETSRQLQAVRGSMRAIRRILLSTYLLDPECGLFASSDTEREQAWKKLRSVLVKEIRRK